MRATQQLALPGGAAATTAAFFFSLATVTTWWAHLQRDCAHRHNSAGEARAGAAPVPRGLRVVEPDDVIEHVERGLLHGLTGRVGPYSEPAERFDHVAVDLGGDHPCRLVYDIGEVAIRETLTGHLALTVRRCGDSTRAPRKWS